MLLFIVHETRLIKMILQSPCGLLGQSIASVLFNPEFSYPVVTASIQVWRNESPISSIVVYFLCKQGLVKKLVCNDFASNTVQRFYEFNMSLDHVVTNMISGEQCGRYQLTYLAGTNTFLGIVNTSCNLTAFCPCPTV